MRMTLRLFSYGLHCYACTPKEGMIYVLVTCHGAAATAVFCDNGRMASSSFDTRRRSRRRSLMISRRFASDRLGKHLVSHETKLKATSCFTFGQHFDVLGYSDCREVGECPFRLNYNLLQWTQ